MRDGNKTKIENAFKTKEVISFVDAVKSYCQIIEDLGDIDSKTYLQKLLKNLSQLYLTAMNLPSVNPEATSEIDFNFSIEEMQLLISKLSKKIPFQYYWTVLNSVDSKNSPVFGTGDLTDDLMDIYKDIKWGLQVIEREDVLKADALWHLKFQFDNHWKDHCIEAMNAIHHYLSDNIG